MTLPLPRGVLTNVSGKQTHVWFGMIRHFGKVICHQNEAEARKAVDNVAMLSIASSDYYHTVQDDRILQVSVLY